MNAMERERELLGLYLRLRRLCMGWIDEEASDEEYSTLVSLQGMRDEVAGLDGTGFFSQCLSGGAPQTVAGITSTIIDQGIDGLGAIDADDATTGEVMGRVVAAFFQTADDPFRFMGAFTEEMRKAAGQG